jgi:hypothetical protein
MKFQTYVRGLIYEIVDHIRLFVMLFEGKKRS